jgi:hypothetical protein
MSSGSSWLRSIIVVSSCCDVDCPKWNVSITSRECGGSVFFQSFVDSVNHHMASLRLQQTTHPIAAMSRSASPHPCAPLPHRLSAISPRICIYPHARTLHVQLTCWHIVSG